MRVSQSPSEDEFFLPLTQWTLARNSLQATWIRNTLIHALRGVSTVNTHDIPSNFVYAYPSIRALSTFLSRLISGETAHAGADAERAAAIARMRALLDKYSAGLERHFPEKLANGHVHGARAGAETVILTGTTGRLGTHLLAQLLARDDVAKVYALNREPTGSVQALEARQKAAFEQWGLDGSLLTSGKVTLHVVDLAKTNLGLSGEVYEQVSTACRSPGWHR